MSITPKDLTEVVPTSPASRVGGYVILARLADGARAEFLGGNVGEHHTGCPLDHVPAWSGSIRVRHANPPSGKRVPPAR